MHLTEHYLSGTLLNLMLFTKQRNTSGFVCTDTDRPIPLTNAPVTSRRPLAVHTRVSLTTPCEDVVRVTAREAQSAVPVPRAHDVAAESPGARPEVEAVLWRTLPFAGDMTLLIFISIEVVQYMT